MIRTKLTEMLGIEYPIVQGCMQWISRAPLVAAVSEAGGLGLLSSSTFSSADELQAEIRKIKSMTSKPFAVNLTLMPSLVVPDYAGYIRVCAEEGVKVMETAGSPPKDDMVRAIKDAGIKPEDIDYVNVHGTSTPAGDIPELKAVAGVLGDHVYNVNISSTKSMTGHLLGAAGAAEALACIFAITHGVIPPTINCDNLDPEIDPNLNLTLNKAQKREVRCALSNTFGFGGHNSTVIFRKI